MRTRAAFLAIAASAALVHPLHAAVIASQGFEGSTSDTWAYTLSGQGGAITNTNPSTDTPKSSRVRSGSYSFQETTTSNGSYNTGTLTFAPQLITGYTDRQIQIPLAAISLTSGNGLDVGDNVQVFVALDGGIFSTAPDVEVTGNGNATWSYTSGAAVAEVTAGDPQGTTFKPAAGGARTTDGYGLIAVDIPDSASTVQLQITASDNSTGEVWAIDDVSITGNPVPEPATLAGVGLLGLGLLNRRRAR